ncbi:MAG: rhomboid family intramembrane serine protease [Planctomycetota bacterium]
MTEQFLSIYESADRRQCMELRLVLLASGVAAEVQPDGPLWHLVIAEANYEKASRELTAYHQDQQPVSTRNAIIDSFSSPGTYEGILGYGLLLAFVSFLVWSTAFGEAMDQAGQMNAGRLLSGEWWRAITALTLHVDTTHLVSNLFFGALFGYLACQLLGGGMAWFLILLGGSLGNLANAALRDPSHLSVGASTAVFAALGIAVAHALRPTLREKELPWMKRWSPLIGGILLLAMVGLGGERTDVGAHVTGFGGGFFTGWLASKLGRPWLQNRRVQLAAGFAAISLVAVAWFCGMWILRSSPPN